MKTVLVGKSCAGKDKLSMLLQDMGYRRAIMHTSRPPRHYEVDGIHYRFLDKDGFIDLVKKHALLYHQVFNDWYYGLSLEEFEKSDVAVVTPAGVKSILEHFKRSDVCIVYVDTDSRERMIRSIKRGDDPSEVIRRYITDDEDFENFDDWDYRIEFKNDPKFEQFFKFFESQKSII